MGMSENELNRRLMEAALDPDLGACEHNGDNRLIDDTPQPPECMWCERPAVGLLKHDPVCDKHGHMYDSEMFPFVLYEDMGPNE